MGYGEILFDPKTIIGLMLMFIFISCGLIILIDWIKDRKENSTLNNQTQKSERGNK